MYTAQYIVCTVSLILNNTGKIATFLIAAEPDACEAFFR